MAKNISRFVCNTKDLLFLVDELKSRGMDFVSLKESIDFMLTVFAAMAQLERDCILSARVRVAITKDRVK